MICNSGYGFYRNMSFSEIFDSYEKFKEEYDANEIGKPLNDEQIKTLFYLLYARYANSTIASDDPMQFKYRIWSLIFTHGPAWAKRLEIQDKLRNLSENELLIGSTQINNHSYNPSTEPSTATLDELTTIDNQNTTKYKRSKLDAYGLLWSLLRTDVTEDFLNKFRKLFLTFVRPEYPAIFIDEEEGE